MKIRAISPWFAILGIWIVMSIAAFALEIST